MPAPEAGVEVEEEGALELPPGVGPMEGPTLKKEQVDMIIESVISLGQKQATLKDM